jgi:alkanesulfonate monooxygenase SsuD/methylene tetrahydromethanopterin reductase-like flavin-dependent oxidoreductase (luciferase family)
LWRRSGDNEPSVYFTGRYFKLNGAPSKKPRKTIPITIAARNRKTMQIAAKYADVWESSYITPEEFASLNKRFEDIKPKQPKNNNNGSSNKAIKKSIELDVLIADSDSDLEYKKRIFAMERGPGVAHQVLKYGLVGKPGKIAERLKEYTNAGINQFILAFQDPFDSRALESFTDAFGK